ncbi:hypothetical protein [Streptomyces sp. NPDC047315]|uniref:hypothetical protein n=1 Tax=Streptomyces sp. NPDC047315 TaxID=3155142 RepID=UPI0033C46F11
MLIEDRKARAMDPHHPVIALCAEGMRAEAAGSPERAHELFRQAWETAEAADPVDDYAACVAAHYVARHQPAPRDALHWNLVCLERADRVGDERVRGFHPSLHLNLAAAYRELDEPARAREHFARAAEHLDDVPEGPYAQWIRIAVAEGLRWSGSVPERPAEPLVARLLAEFCARGDLKALGLVLPAYLTDLGGEDDRVRLVTALHQVHASRWLPPDASDDVGRVIAALGAS